MTPLIPPAILEFDDQERADYRLVTPSNFVRLNFPPDRQNITLSVIIFNDDLPEGTEAFRVILLPHHQIFQILGLPQWEVLLQVQMCLSLMMTVSWPVNVQHHAIVWYWRYVGNSCHSNNTAKFYF